MQATPKIHSQTLGRVLGTLLKVGWRIVGARRMEDPMRTLSTKSTKQCSWGLTEASVSTMEPTWVCARFSAYVLGLCRLCSCGTPSSQTEGVSDSWDPLPSLALTWGSVPSLVASCYAMLCCYPWKAALFCREQRRSGSGVEARWWGKLGGMERWETSVGMYMKEGENVHCFKQG